MMKSHQSSTFLLAALGAFVLATGHPASAQDAQTTVVPLTSRFVLNGERLDYGFTNGFSFGLGDGNKRNLEPQLIGTIALDTSLSESLSDNVYERRQEGWYLQLQTARKTQEITVRQRQAIDVTGFRLQLSVTGACQVPGTESGQICTYTPGLATDPDRFDSVLGLPTGFNETTRTGQVISEETQDALRAEGFQRGVAGSDEQVGIDFDIPNSGYVADASRARENGIDREEHNTTRLVATISNVIQRLYSNSDEAALSRTIRSFVLLKDGEWSRKAVLMQAAAWILPGFDPQLQASGGEANLSIGNNLFYAANNLRVPANSFTVFQSGVGRIRHPVRQPRSASEAPAGFFSSFWMGFSPVRNIRSSSDFSLELTGDRITRSGPFFAQGGSATGLALPQSSVTVIDRITDSITQIELSQIDDLFVQSGLELTTQSALAYSSSTETSYYHLRPHLSLSGNRTDGNSVLRYYGGIILADEHNAYIGGDYSLATDTGYRFTAHAEAYSHPDRDYYSFAEARVLKTTERANGDSFTLGVGARKEFDRPNTAVDALDALSSGSVVDLLFQYEVSGGIRYDVRQRFSEENNDSKASTTFGVSYGLSDSLSLTAQLTPVSNEDAYIRARAGLSLKPGRERAGTIQVQWADIQYDYGRDSVGKKLETSEQIFLASYQKTF